MKSRTDNERVALSSYAEALDVSATDATLSGAGFALYVGTGGDIKVDTLGSTAVTFANVQDGTFMPILVTKVYTADTTASNIVAIG